MRKIVICVNSENSARFRLCRFPPWVDIERYASGSVASLLSNRSEKNVQHKLQVTQSFFETLNAVSVSNLSSSASGPNIIFSVSWRVITTLNIYITSTFWASVSLRVIYVAYLVIQGQIFLRLPSTFGSQSSFHHCPLRIALWWRNLPPSLWPESILWRCRSLNWGFRLCLAALLVASEGVTFT